MKCTWKEQRSGGEVWNTAELFRSDVKTVKILHSSRLYYNIDQKKGAGIFQSIVVFCFLIRTSKRLQAAELSLLGATLRLSAVMQIVVDHLFQHKFGCKFVWWRGGFFSWIQGSNADDNKIKFMQKRCLIKTRTYVQKSRQSKADSLSSLSF